ncbi:MAG: ABC transporter ATP-binding protein [Legionellales bacterium]|jgi:ABC-type lipoprotein export system ATPase subunit|nr:ABC transporter ATP-binding protein [Legionellales bacterium]
MNKKYIIEASSIYKEYIDGDAVKVVLNNIDYSQHYGSTCAIIGPSGSGKTTLLHALAGLDTISSGTTLLCGHDLKKIRQQQLSQLHNKKIGFVYQKSHLLPDFNVLENIAMPLLIGGMKSKLAQKQAMQVLTEIKLEQYAYYYPHQLSGGTQQKAAIARASVHKPDIIFADEPTGNLDSVSKELVLNCLFDLNKHNSVALCIVTHDQKVAARADEIVDMSKINS